MNVTDYVEQVTKGKQDAFKHIKDILKTSEKINNEYHYFNTISDWLALAQVKNKKKGKLAGVAISVKDNICVKGVESQAGSAILHTYKPVFDATVIEKCVDEGAVIIGKTSQDEFGFGSFNVSVGNHMKIPLNPFDKTRACGGSSGGAAGTVQKLTSAHIALAESTGGSIVAPASFCGVVGLCPTYGLVSRYGLMDFANSLDKIGPIGRSVTDVALLLEIIAGHDSKDSTSVKSKKVVYTKSIKKSIKGMKVGVLKEGFGKGVNKDVAASVQKGIDLLKKKGAKVVDISLPITSKYGVATYYILALCEASTNLAKYCGLRYGESDSLVGISFNAYFSKLRSKHLGEEAKRRIILGTFARMAGYRDAFYIKAAQVRTKIIEEYKKAFKDIDVLVCPTMPVLPPKFTEIKKLTPLEHYMMDILTVGPNLAGLPHLNVPVDKVKGLPVGMLIMGDHFTENKIIQVASWLE